MIVYEWVPLKSVFRTPLRRMEQLWQHKIQEDFWTSSLASKTIHFFSLMMRKFFFRANPNLSCFNTVMQNDIPLEPMKCF